MLNGLKQSYYWLAFAASFFRKKLNREFFGRNTGVIEKVAIQYSPELRPNYAQNRWIFLGVIEL